MTGKEKLFAALVQFLTEEFSNDAAQLSSMVVKASTGGVTVNISARDCRITFEDAFKTNEHELDSKLKLKDSIAELKVIAPKKEEKPTYSITKYKKILRVYITSAIPRVDIFSPKRNVFHESIPINGGDVMTAVKTASIVARELTTGVRVDPNKRKTRSDVGTVRKPQRTWPETGLHIRDYDSQFAVCNGRVVLRSFCFPKGNVGQLNVAKEKAQRYLAEQVQIQMAIQKHEKEREDALKKSRVSSTN